MQWPREPRWQKFSTTSSLRKFKIWRGSPEVLYRTIESLSGDFLRLTSNQKEQARSNQRLKIWNSKILVQWYHLECLEMKYWRTSSKRWKKTDKNLLKNIGNILIKRCLIGSPRFKSRSKSSLIRLPTSKSPRYLDNRSWKLKQTVTSVWARLSRLSSQISCPKAQVAPQAFRSLPRLQLRPSILFLWTRNLKKWPILLARSS